MSAPRTSEEVAERVADLRAAVRGCLDLYVDGSRSAVKGAAGCAWLVVDARADAPLAEGRRGLGGVGVDSAEVAAALHGLARLPDGARLRLFSDYQPLLAGLERLRRGETPGARVSETAALWPDIATQLERLDLVEVRHLPSADPSPWRARVDQAAKAACSLPA